MSFREVTLGEISINNKGSYGISASAVDYSEDLYTYLRITDINDDGTLNKDGLKSVNDENANKYLLKPNDIVFARTGGSTGRSYFYDGSDGEFVYAGFLIKFSLDPNKVNPKYLKYYTLSNEYKGWVNSFNTGSTRGNINAQTYANMKLNLPDDNQQKLLIDTLSCLDDKIELNNKINKTLEKMAQAIFKSWFVDFEPFQDGEFEESELGRIPKGWVLKALYDFADYINGASFKKDEYATSGCPIIKITELKNGITSSTEYFSGTKDEKYYIKTGDMLFSWSGNPKTSIDTFIWVGGDAILNQHTFKISIKNNDYSFIYLLLKFFKPEFTRIASSKQTTGLGHVTVSDLKRIKFPYDHKTVEQFCIMLNPVIEMYVKNLIENEKLKEIRDTLLPKLMSGEIRVPTENVQ